MDTEIITADAEPALLEAGALAIPENRTPAGRFPPGVSGNPGGRPKGLAALIREQTGEGAELVSFALKVLRSPRHEPRLRLQALEWLANRGFGREVQSHEISGPDGASLTFTLRLGERESDE